MKKELFTNGSSTTNQGFKAVVVCPSTRAARPVVAAVRSGYQSARTTLQSWQEGDFVFSCQWNRQVPSYKVTRLDSGGLEKDLSWEIQVEAWKFLPDALTMWLEPQGRGETFLPSGQGWDGVKTLGDLSKERKVTGFLACFMAGEALASAVKQAERSPMKGMPVDWSLTSAMPEKLEVESRNWDGCVVGISQTQVWYAYTPGKNWVKLDLVPTKGEWGSNYAYSDHGRHDEEPLKVPDGVTRLVRVNIRPYIRDHFSWGISWDIFSV